MITNYLYVFIYEVLHKKDADLASFMIDGQYIVKSDGINLYRVYYRYYESFQDAIIDLIKISADFNEPIIFPPSKLNTSYLNILIDNKYGYLFDIKSCLELLLRERTGGIKQ
jgi:hypothetical protein